MSRGSSALLFILVIALVAALAVLVFKDDGVKLAADEPQIVSVSELEDLAAERNAPIYWLGERDGAEYEVTESSSGRFYVRYLDAGADAGDERAEFLTAGTYATGNGVAALRLASRNRNGAKLARTDDGAVLLVDPGSPTNAHLAYRDEDVQIEVFSPKPGEALRLASRGAVQRVPIR